MVTLDDFFKQSTEELSDPRLRDWKRRLAQPGIKAELEIDRSARTIGIAQTEINIRFIENDQPCLETVEWDDDLNAGLVQLGVRAMNPSQEAERFALALRGALRKVEREFGDGYFNAVLLALVKDSDLTRHSEIEEVLRHAYANPPEQSKSHNFCREMITNEISARAHELAETLGYEDEEAKTVLVKALAKYLDERFSVSSRRRMGLL